MACLIVVHKVRQDPPYGWFVRRETSNAHLDFVDIDVGCAVAECRMAARSVIPAGAGGWSLGTADQVPDMAYMDDAPCSGDVGVGGGEVG